jgi:ribosomal protein L40E
MKLSERLQREDAFVQGYLGDRVICSRCNATLATYSAACNADLSESCPGFVKIENAKQEFSDLLKDTHK